MFVLSLTLALIHSSTCNYGKTCILEKHLPGGSFELGEHREYGDTATGEPWHISRSENEDSVTICFGSMNYNSGYDPSGSHEPGKQLPIPHLTMTQSTINQNIYNKMHFTFLLDDERLKCYFGCDEHGRAKTIKKIRKVEGKLKDDSSCEDFPGSAKKYAEERFCPLVAHLVNGTEFQDINDPTKPAWKAEVEAEEDVEESSESKKKTKGERRKEAKKRREMKAKEQKRMRMKLIYEQEKRAVGVDSGSEASADSGSEATLEDSDSERDSEISGSEVSSAGFSSDSGTSITLQGFSDVDNEENLA